MTEAAKHTPGPWITFRAHGGEGYVHTVRRNCAAEPTVALVWDDNDDPSLPCADAILISAAPDLLAFAREVRNRCVLGGTPRHELVDLADAVIAKATTTN